MSIALTLPNFARPKGDIVKPKGDIITPKPSETKKDVVLPRPSPRVPAVAIVGGVVPRTPGIEVALPRMEPGLPRMEPGLPRMEPGLPRMEPGLPRMEVLPRTPLYMPKIGIPKGTLTAPILQPGENPWLPPRVEGASDIKITAITPIGTIAMVPTCDKRPPPTPRRLPQTPTRHLTLRIIDANTGTARIDPLLTAAIYLDCTKPEDRDYNHVAQRMQAITSTTSTLQKQYATTLRPLLGVHGRVSSAVFEEALSIYENNQVYYQDRLDDHSLPIVQSFPLSQIRKELTELEYWFACIIEPKATDDIMAWRERELTKLEKGHTSYCDPELHQYIQPFPEPIRQYIRTTHLGLV